MDAFSPAARREQKRAAVAKSFSIPASPDIRKFSPTRVTPVKLSVSLIRTSGTPARMPMTKKRRILTLNL
jgi:hypothetical protein